MKKTIRIVLDVRLVLACLLLIIMLMVISWRPPWAADGSRRITVAGHARIKAQPDYYLFSVQYRANANDSSAREELDRRTQPIIDTLLDMGVASTDIEVQASAYDQSSQITSADGPISAHIMIRAIQPNVAQAVRDYLPTTRPSYATGPIAGFTESKRKNLQNEARDKAVADATIQAERTARQLNTKLGKVMEVRDTVIGEIAPGAKSSDAEAGAGLILVEQEISFSVEATFLVR